MKNERLKGIEFCLNNKASNHGLHFQEVEWLISRVKALTEALEHYRGIAGHDCDKSTTKWSLSDQVLNEPGDRSEGEKEKK